VRAGHCALDCGQGVRRSGTSPARSVQLTSCACVGRRGCAGSGAPEKHAQLRRGAGATA
jgi:hypothetical protein